MEAVPKNSLFNISNSAHLFLGIREVLKTEESGLSAFELLLDLYFSDIKCEKSKEEILTCLDPVSTVSGLTMFPYNGGIDFFFKYIERQDIDKTRALVEDFCDRNNDYVMVSGKHSYRAKPPLKYSVTDQDFYDAKAKGFSWLLSHSADTESIIKTLQILLGNIHYIPLEQLRPKFTEEIEKILSTDDDETKALAFREIAKSKENVLMYPDWHLEWYAPFFDELLDKVRPSNTFLLDRDILVDDNYPLPNPPVFGDEGFHEKTMKLRSDRRDEIINKLIKTCGKDVISQIISYCNDTSFAIWDTLFEKSATHLQDIREIVEKKKIFGARIYFGRMDSETLLTALNELGDNDFVIQNLPFKEEIFRWIDGRELEPLYWKSKHCNFSLVQDKDYEYVFSKFLKFAPEKMIGYFAYRPTADYDHCMRLLERMCEMLTTEEEKASLISEINDVKAYVKKMDKLFYTKELASCEFRLLPLLIGHSGDFPSGVQNFFWENPEDFSGFLCSIYEQRGELPKDSLGEHIFMDVYTGIGRTNYIPKDYPTQKGDQIGAWIDKFLKVGKGKDIEEIRFLNKAAISVLAHSAKTLTDTVWPSEDIANALEQLGANGYDDQYKVSTEFYVRWSNQRGCRTIGDGSKEESLYNEYTRYEDHYRYTHPVTSRALEHIANSFKRDAERIKRRKKD